MPLITKEPKRMGSIVVTEFVDSVGVSPVSFSIPNDIEQDTLTVYNISPMELLVSAGTQTDVSILPYRGVTLNETFTSFSIKSTFGVAGFRATCSYQDSDEEDELVLTQKINQLTTSLAQSMNSIIDYNNRAGRGYGVYFGEFTATEKTKVIQQIQSAIDNHCDSICFYIDLDVDSNGAYDTTRYNNLITYWNQVFAVFQGVEWKRCILRTGSGIPSSATNAFFNGVAPKCKALLDNLNYDFDVIVIQNESPTTTTSDAYVTNWQSVISSIKTNYPNIKVTMSPTQTELRSMPNALLTSLDFIGVNWYPNLTYNPILNQANQKFIDQTLMSTMEEFEMLVRQFNKKLVILEIGCARGKYNYMNAGDWHIGTTEDLTTRLRWWQSVLPIIDNARFIDFYSMFYTPLMEEITRSFISDYFREGVQNGKY
jgi:hypothetical protein